MGSQLSDAAVTVDLGPPRFTFDLAAGPLWTGDSGHDLWIDDQMDSGPISGDTVHADSGPGYDIAARISNHSADGTIIRGGVR